VSTLEERIRTEDDVEKLQRSSETIKIKFSKIKSKVIVLQQHKHKTGTT